MYTTFVIPAALAAFASAQDTSFKPSTGVRSLWIPFQTISGTPVASIAYDDVKNNVTAYVISCPTASPQCAIAPNITLTEGITEARYVVSNSVGAATIDCQYPDNTNTATCVQGRIGTDSNIDRTSTTISGSQINFQAVAVTQTATNTSTIPATVTVTPSATSTSSSTSSAGGVQTAAPVQWTLGSAIGAGLLALAAL